MHLYYTYLKKNPLYRKFLLQPQNSSKLFFYVVECLSGVASGVEALSLVDMSRAFSKFATTCSIDGRCCLTDVHERASWNVRSKASTEYSPSSLGSANSFTPPPLLRTLAWEHWWVYIRTDGHVNPEFKNERQLGWFLTILFNAIGFFRFKLKTFFPERICSSTIP